jgi:hypothetical protein
MNKAIEKERQLKTYISKLCGIQSALLLKERKAKCVAIKSSNHWKDISEKRTKKIIELKGCSNKVKDELARVTQ